MSLTVSYILDASGDLSQDNSVHEWMRDSSPSPHDVSIRTVPGKVTSFSTSGATTAYLFTDNRFAGWGDSNEGQLPEQVELPEKARAVYVSLYHTFILVDTGKVYVWGGCHASGMAVAGDVPDIIEAVQYPLQDVQDIAVSMDDNMYPDTFLKKDGTVWIGYPPANSNVHNYSFSYPPTNTDIHNFACGKTFSDESLVHHMEMPVPAVAIAMGSDGTHPYPILALDAAGGLWGANFRGSYLRNWQTGGITSMGGAIRTDFKK